MYHSQKKAEQQLTPQQQAHKQALAQKVGQSLDEFFLVKQGKMQVKCGLQYTQELAKLCPDLNSIYIYRRQLLLDELASLPDQPTKYSLLAQEIQLLSALLREMPKSYCLWNHRKWVIIQSMSFQLPYQDTLICQDFKLCAKMLTKDERNFHVWNYRMWLANQLDQPTTREQELEFTQDKITQNFTNFSALHFRSKYLLKVWHDRLPNLEQAQQHQVLQMRVPLEQIRSELEQMMTGLFMQPTEQGVWQAYRWITDLLVPIKLLHVQVMSNHQLCLYFSDFINHLSPANLIILYDGHVISTEILRPNQYQRQWVIQLEQHVHLDQVQIYLKDCLQIHQDGASLENSIEQAIVSVKGNRYFQRIHVTFKDNQAHLHPIAMDQDIQQIFDEQAQLITELQSLEESEQDNKYIMALQSAQLLYHQQSLIQTCQQQSLHQNINELISLYDKLEKRDPKLGGIYQSKRTAQQNLLTIPENGLASWLMNRS